MKITYNSLKVFIKLSNDGRDDICILKILNHDKLRAMLFLALLCLCLWRLTYIYLSLSKHGGETACYNFECIFMNENMNIPWYFLLWKHMCGPINVKPTMAQIFDVYKCLWAKKS